MRKSLMGFGLTLVATAVVTSQVMTERPREIASPRPGASEKTESHRTTQATRPIEEFIPEAAQIGTFRHTHYRDQKRLIRGRGEYKSPPRAPLAVTVEVETPIPRAFANVPPLIEAGELPLLIETDELPRRPRSHWQSEIKGFDFKDFNFRDLAAELDLGGGRRDLGLYVPAE